MNDAPRLRLHLTPAAERAVRRRHPWVYADRIRDQNRAGVTGELAVLYDGRNRFLALGLYDAESPIRVRVLHCGEPTILDREWWQRRLDQALARRASLFEPHTTGWRCIHGESDGWPGLVLDRYGAVLVLKLYTLAWLPRLAELVTLFQENLRPDSLVLRLSRNIAVAAERDYQRTDGTLLAGQPVAGAVVFLENGLRFEADVLRGQKTGFFLDQRENRQIVGSLSCQADVLNAFSFSGGFSLYAARAGARSVTDIDISAHALASSRRNFALNHDVSSVAAARHETIQADVFEWLGQRRAPGYDLVILDPPSMARRETERDAALKAYTQLARLASVNLRAGGTLVASSCSAHVPVAAFHQAVRDGVSQAGMACSELRSTTHPPDHPADFPEAHYLKALYLKVSSPRRP